MLCLSQCGARRLAGLTVLFLAGSASSALAQKAHFSGAVRLTPERSVYIPVRVGGTREAFYADTDKVSFLQQLEEQRLGTEHGAVATDGVSSKTRLIAHDATANPTPAGAVNFGSVAIGAAPVTMSLTFTFTSGGTIGTPQVLTMGAPNLDFADAGTGTCTTNGTSFVYDTTTNNTCTVDVTFTPKFSGERNGGVVLTDTSGTAVAASVYIYGTATGPQVTYSPAVPSTVGSGFGQSSGIAVDGSGNVFVSDFSNSAVYEVVATGGYNTVQQIGSGFTHPQGVAVDGSGNVFVADSANSRIYEVLAAGGYNTQVQLGSGFTFAAAVALDGIGNVFVIDSTYPGVFEIPAAGGAPILLGGGYSFAYPRSIAVDGSGNLFVVDGNGIEEILEAGGYTTVNLLSNNTLTGIIGVAVDANDNLIVVNGNGAGTVYELTAASGYATQQTLASGFAQLGAVALAANGDIFVAAPSETVAHRVDFSDPPTLSFATTQAGNTSSDSPQTVTITNFGNAALAFTVPSSGTNPSIASGFNVGGSSTCPQLTTSSSLATLAVGATCTYLVNFAPLMGGSISGALTITDNAAAVQTIQLSGTATPGAPTISFSVPNQTYGVAPFTVNATSNSSGAFTYSVVSGPATISGNTVTLTGTGTVVLQASQAAATGYLAGSANASFSVGTAAVAPTISFSVPNHTFGDAPFTVNATSNSSGAFAYSVVSGPATISGNTVTLTGAGTVVLQASQAAATVYLSGSANATFTVASAPATPTISFSVPNHTFGDAPFTVSATSNSSGAFSYSVVSGPATISGNTVTLTDAGTVILQASEAAASGYSAGSATATFVVAASVGIGTGTGSSSSATVTAGSSASFALSMSPQGGNTFTDNITFAATGLPSDATATFSPAQISAGSPATTVTLTVQTTSQDARTREPFSRSSPFGSLAWGLILLPLAGNRRLRRQLRNVPIVMLMICVVGMFSLVGCGGGNSGGGGGGITSQTYNLTVTATDTASGAKTTTPLTLIVQS